MSDKSSAQAKCAFFDHEGQMGSCTFVHLGHGRMHRSTDYAHNVVWSQTHNL